MVATATILRDVLFFLKNDFQNNITDPISSTRPAGEQFVMTSYPQRAVTYPIITIKDLNSEDVTQLGFQSEAMQHYVTMEIRIWARTVAQRDQITDSVYNRLRDNQIGISGTSQANDIHDFRLLSMTNIDEADGPKSKILTIRYLFIAT